jgi:hypothetical protein
MPRRRPRTRGRSRAACARARLPQPQIHIKSCFSEVSVDTLCTHQNSHSTHRDSNRKLVETVQVHRRTSEVDGDEAALEAEDERGGDPHRGDLRAAASLYIAPGRGPRAGRPAGGRARVVAQPPSLPTPNLHRLPPQNSPRGPCPRRRWRSRRRWRGWLPGPETAEKGG